ncbi:hypothetical protein ACP21Z_04245 [Staphylococcus epidermidis]|nr:hypothetical protein [Staphylococcus epidermidis]MDH9423232.1 hypothetical protein [Staphylococcus epidermidis]MDH9432444.1 hypothetical protein [Staphylococcus epidermidis]MDH9447797.1 hypothetical protein [Staphylococcus epidermidis]MDH9452545.1 hypothetical protein [Staphylococcus epidermidis]
MEISVLIPTHNISRHVNDIVEIIPDTEFDEFRHHRGLIKKIIAQRADNNQKIIKKTISILFQ